MVVQIINSPAPFGAKICSDICPRKLSVPRSEHFSENVARGKLRAFKSRQRPRKISEHILAPNGGYCVCCPSNIFHNMRNFEKRRISLGYSTMVAGAHSVT